MNASPHVLIEATLQKLEGAYAPSTLNLYRTDFKNFDQFCCEHGFHSLAAPPAAWVLYISELTNKGYSPGGIRRILYSLANLHRLSLGRDPTQHPDVELAIRRMHRLLGRSARQARGIREDELDAMSRVCDDSLRGFRNRVLIRVGYDTLCRVGELVSLNVEDVHPKKIRLRRSKTDPDGRGCWLYLSSEGDRLLFEWLERSALHEGPIFTGWDPLGHPKNRLQEGEVTRILKHLARRAGIGAQGISGHSLRVGGAQDLLLKGASLRAIMQRGRWAKTDTVMRYLEHTPMAPSDGCHRNSDFDVLPD